MEPNKLTDVQRQFAASRIKFLDHLLFLLRFGQKEVVERYLEDERNTLAASLVCDDAKSD